MDKEIVWLANMIKRWKREADSFFNDPKIRRYEPDLNVSHIWSNLQTPVEAVSDALLDYAEYEKRGEQ